jgi:hypothetical protein
MSLKTSSFNPQTESITTESSTTELSGQPNPQPPTAGKAPPQNPPSTKVTFEVPTNSSLPVNPFDPSWLKLWEQVGPISYLALLCVFIWLLTRLVETVKGK